MVAPHLQTTMSRIRLHILGWGLHYARALSFESLPLLVQSSESAALTHVLMACTRGRQTCHFRKRTASAPAEGPACGLDLVGRCESPLRALQPRKWRVYGSGTILLTQTSLSRSISLMTRSAGKSAYQGKLRMLAPVRPRMQAAGLQCLKLQSLKLQIVVASPDSQTRAVPGTELPQKTRSPKFDCSSECSSYLQFDEQTMKATILFIISFIRSGCVGSEAEGPSL